MTEFREKPNFWSVRRPFWAGMRIYLDEDEGRLGT